MSTKRMRRSIAIFLLGIFLSSTTEAHQLLKLPALFEHLSEHQEDGPMSWMEFMSEHYLHAGDHADRDHHHHNLPFHSDNHNGAQTIQARLPETSSLSFAILNGLDVELISMDERMPIRNGLDDVWQPPRM
ncbi:MAG: hypothetical protein WBG34_00210 [Flavobacteriales bacterium]